MTKDLEAQKTGYINRRTGLKWLGLGALAAATTGTYVAMQQPATPHTAQDLDAQFENGKPGKTVIVGSGLAGLVAAYEFKKRGVDFVILEASNRAGGRVHTEKFADGTEVSMGAAWLHGGEENQMMPLIKELGLEYTVDDPEKNVLTLFKGECFGPAKRSSLQNLNFNMILAGLNLKDADLTVLAGGDADKLELINRMAPLWVGVEAKNASTIELATDPNGPGGLLLKGGAQALIDRLVKEIGEENIIYGARVKSVGNIRGESARITYIKDGEVENETGQHCIVALPAEVVKKLSIVRQPKGLKEHLEPIQPAKFEKICIKLDPAFFEGRTRQLQDIVDINSDKPLSFENSGAFKDLSLKNFHLDLTDATPPTYCHINTNGQPIITLMVGGDGAEQIRTLSQNPAELKKWIAETLSPAAKAGMPLEGYKKHLDLASPPLVSSWGNNPFSLCSYYTRKPSGNITSASEIEKGPIVFAGDGFAPQSPGTMAGAYLSAIEAVYRCAEVAQQQQKQKVTGR